MSLGYDPTINLTFFLEYLKINKLARSEQIRYDVYCFLHMTATQKRYLKNGPMYIHTWNQGHGYKLHKC